MRIYTTPTLSLKVKGVDITSASHVYVTLNNGTGSMTKDENDITMTLSGSDTVIELSLTQDETRLFRPNTRASVEVNWIEDSVRSATEIVNIVVENNLLKEVKL